MRKCPMSLFSGVIKLETLTSVGTSTTQLPILGAGRVWSAQNSPARLLETRKGKTTVEDSLSVSKILTIPPGLASYKYDSWVSAQENQKQVHTRLSNTTQTALLWVPKPEPPKCPSTGERTHDSCCVHTQRSAQKLKGESNRNTPKRGLVSHWAEGPRIICVLQHDKVPQGYKNWGAGCLGGGVWGQEVWRTLFRVRVYLIALLMRQL